MILLWDDENIAHLATHSVTREEADFVVKSAAPPYPAEVEGEKFVVWGQSPEGRYLQVIFVLLDEDQVDWEKLDARDKMRFAEGAEEVGRVIHARDLTTREKKNLRRSRRKRP